MRRRHRAGVSLLLLCSGAALAHVHLRDSSPADGARLAAAPTANRYAPKPKIPELPAYIDTAFKTDRKAWTFFQTLSDRNRRDFVVWIHTAKRPETRERRIRQAIELLSAGKKLGLK